MFMEDNNLLLPPGFRFHPTDEEIITHYLTPKILDHDFVAQAMGVVNLNKCEPWDLPAKAEMGEKEWYFYCQKDRKYPTGTRTNRATASGYWKATGKDKEIFRESGVLVGMRKTLVFYTGRAPKGEKTNWVMHEFRLQGRVPFFSNLHKSAKDEWIVCRVFHKNTAGAKKGSTGHCLPRPHNLSDDLSDAFLLPPLMDPPCFNCGGGDGDSFDMKEFMQDSALLPTSYHCTSLINGGNSLPLSPIKRHCKAEQLSNQSMLSQDASFSADRYAEISSSMISQDFDIGDLDLCSMWR